MSKAKINTFISGTCLVLGLGGIAGACETGKGFLLSAVLVSCGFAFGYWNGRR